MTPAHNATSRVSSASRDKQTGEMTWYCTAHRLGQFWADARRGAARLASDPDWEGWK